jgi:hypothetical protein
MARTGLRCTNDSLGNLVSSGVPERVAMMATGHKIRSVFDRCHIVNRLDLQDAARKLTSTFGESALDAGVGTV